MTTILVTGASGDTGRPTVERLLEQGFEVRALVRRDDHRAQTLRDIGAEVVLGDLMSLRDVRLAMDGVQRAYFCFPLAEGLVEAAVIFAQAAKEQNLELIVNMSHKQSRPAARSKATQNHWLSEQIFNWSGVPSVHLRVTFFAEWLLYIAPQIRYGRYVMPYNKDSRFAPIAGSDIARIIAGIVKNPAPYIGRAIALHGPVEYSHEELAAEVGRVLGKNLPYEHVTVSTFLELFGLQDAVAMRRHFEAVTIDQQEGLLAGTDSTGTEIIGQPLATVEEFIQANLSKFVLEYPLARSSR
ncbi:NmrA family NAD(P)-binding protein [Caballeronia sp. LZ035]|uniref:NmrA family NAD(P)-binding protein n=1 Tax=Caballeronia sp. LZ035 TaxID=3038568 RepID=UPI00285B24D0|nr:NmrA family NAD(P)-binding protein [Caballeronia sp. LZ035]MDR5760665.1 NmrA family NAD(P)-binding protein [Caballeronia sp. LZ035]